MNMPHHAEHGPVAGGRRQEWDQWEAAIHDALRRMRALVDGVHAVDPSAEFGVVDVVRGSRGVWQAWWLYADLHAAPAVAAIVPDLRPLAEVVGGPAAEDFAEVRSLLGAGGAAIRLILPTSAHDSAVTRAVVDQLARAGIEIRTADAAPWFFVSSSVVVVPTEGPRTEDIDVAVLRGGPIVDAFAELFEHRWAVARPWGAEADGQEQVLRLLAAGHADEEAAAQLGLSVRTVRRRVADAMQAHGARTRFELGLRYADRRQGGPAARNL